MDEGSLKGDVRWEERKKKQERGGGETYKYLELRELSSFSVLRKVWS